RITTRKRHTLLRGHRCLFPTGYKRKGQILDGIDFKNVITAAELVRMQWRPHGWVLWQMIPQGGITLLAGETASGKSFLGLDLALGVASARGKAWDMELGESQESAKPPILSDTDTLPRFTDPPSMYRPET